MKLVVATVLVMASAALAAPMSPHNHGASTTCEDMLPVHGNAQPSNTTSPYQITVTPTSVNGGGIVRVRVAGADDDKYKGVYLQARRGLEPVGEFLLPIGASSSLAINDCLPGHKNAVWYISRSPLEPLEIDWQAPNYDAEIVFRATIVKSFSEFWVGVESQKIAIEERTTPSEETAPVTENAIAA